MNCTKCGAPIKEGACFCAQCGTRILKQDVFSVSDKTLTVDDMKKMEEQSRSNVQKQENLACEGQSLDNHEKQGAENHEKQGLEDYKKTQQAVNLNKTTAIPSSENNATEKEYNVREREYNVRETDKSSSDAPALTPLAIKRQNKTAKKICVFLSILLLLSLTISSLLTLIHMSYSEMSIKVFINEEEIYKLKLPENDDGDKKTVSDVVYDSVIYYIDSDLIVSRSDVKNLLKKRFIKNFLSEIILEYRNYVFYGEMGEGITPERFADFMIENKVEILSALAKDSRGDELVMFVEEYELFDREYILQEAEIYLDEEISINALDEDYGGIINTIRFFLLKNFVLVMWCVTAVIALTIILLSLTNVANVLSYIGASFASLGGLLFAVKFIIQSFVGSSVNTLIYKVANLFLSNVSWVSVTFLIVGISMIVARIIALIVQKVRLKKQLSKTSSK